MLLGQRSPVRADVRHGQGFTEVILRRNDRWKSLIKLVLFLAAWLFGGLFAALLLSFGSEDRVIMLGLWLAVWAIVGTVFIGMLLWGLLGVDSLVSRSEGLSVVRRFLLYRHETPIAANRLGFIRFNPDDPMRRVRINNRRVPQPVIEVGSDGRLFKLGYGISAPEAEAAIQALDQRLGFRRRAA